MGVIPQLEQRGDLVKMMTMAMISIMKNDTHNARVRLALKPRFLSKGLASEPVRICVFVAYRVSGHSTQDN